LLPFASCAEVKKEVRKAIESAGPGYCVGSSTELHNAIPLRNIRAMIETAEEYRY
jgi:uroporphyrinogen-III decarboxylase